MSGTSSDEPTLENLAHKLKGMENWYEELMRNSKSYKESTDKHLKTLSESLVKVVDQIEQMNRSHKQLTENIQNMNIGHENIVRRIGLLEAAGEEGAGATAHRHQRYDDEDEEQSVADDEEEDESVGNRRRRRIRDKDDPLSKVKFTMPSFDGKFEPSVYLDWELAVEQKFSCYDFPDNKKVKAASSEFTSFASLWWNDICGRGLRPRTWDDMKRTMRSRFVPSYYARDMLNKLQLLRQGSNSVETYYQEMMIALSRCNLQETEDARISRFYGGLNREIRDILEYKEYNTMNRLFHFACKAEREVQGRNKHRSSFAGATSTRQSTPRQSTTAVRPASSTPPTSTPSHAQETSKNASVQTPAKSATSVDSTGRTRDITCHRCHGIGHCT